MTISLPLHDAPSSDSSTSSSYRRAALLLLALPVLGVIHLSPCSPVASVSSAVASSTSHGHGHGKLCPAQPEAIAPPILLQFPPEYRDQSAARLSGAVQIPSVSYDDNGTPEDDPRWAPFLQLHDFLKTTFSDVFAHDAVTLETVNTLALLTTIQGSDPSLKPLLLMSHLDVTPVPLETYDRWTHPPFSGHNDGTYIWGRGSGDCKNLLIAQYEALSLLLADPTFKPRRTVILSHGFDEEEVFARQGAGELAIFLEKRYGKDSMLLIIGEGTSMDRAFGLDFAIPSTTEKGYLDVKLSIGTLGGHSSIPPPHSGIGIAGDVVHAIEANPYPPSFGEADPYHAFLACALEHDAPSFPKSWAKLLRSGKGKDLQRLAERFADTGVVQHALVTTTQAVDVINGGVKVNSLPEEVVILMNHRIAFSSSIAQTQAHLAKTVAPVARHFNMTLSAFEDGSPKLGNRYIKLETFGLPLEPAPRSTVEGGVWDLFAGSIRHAHPTSTGKSDRIVSPFASTGNTDTKVYHNLSKAVYRFVGQGPTDDDGAVNAHTVDEHASIDGHLSIIKWIHTIVQNADLYEGEE